MIAIDTSTEYGARVAHRLVEEQIVWLTATGTDGTPQPNPVWFVWDGAQLFVFSQPDAVKLRLLARNPRVSVNFNSNAFGGDVVIFTGTAAIGGMLAPTALAAYVEKYHQGFLSLGTDAVGFLNAYSVLITITPERARGL